MTTDPSPKLPLWVFVVSDVALLVTAWLIAEYSRHPLSPAAVAAIAGCAALGTLVLLVPLLVRYERLKNEVLDERQRSLEGIARTVQESAEQLSIAANGLNQIANLARQSLETAEALPDKLKKQIGAFEAKAIHANDAERTRLEQELATARQANAAQLAAVATQIALATTEWTKLEAASRLQLSGAHEALAQLDQQAAAKITAAHARALTELDTQLKSLVERVAATTAVVTPTSAVPTPVASVASPEVTPPSVAAPLAAPAAAESTPVVAAVMAAEPTAVETPIAATPPTPKRPRKPRRETPPVVVAPEGSAVAIPEPIPDSAAAESTASTAPLNTEPSPASPPPPTPAVAPEPVAAAIPAVASAETPAEPASSVPTGAIEPSPAMATATPVPSEVATTETSPVTPIAPAAPATPPEPMSAPAPVETPRRRAARAKPEPEPEPMLDLAIDDSAPPARSIERGLSSDGATRLIVTAYIGIGNRLFIRGEGPGLSPDKGVPLQFVSIGKWRWETNDATAPIRFRILKNDAVECAALGEQTLDPGYQAEFGANF